MVDRYTVQLVQMLVSEYTPAQVCAELGLCNKGINLDAVQNRLSDDILSNDIPSLESYEDESDESSEEGLEELEDKSMESVEMKVMIILFFRNYHIYPKRS